MSKVKLFQSLLLIIKICISLEFVGMMLSVACVLWVQLTSLGWSFPSSSFLWPGFVDRYYFQSGFVMEYLVIEISGD